MPDIESQIQTYSSWLMEQADASVDVSSSQAIEEPSLSHSTLRRWQLLLSVAAGIVALVIGLAVVVDQRDQTPAAPVATVAPPADTTPITSPPTVAANTDEMVESVVSLADGFDALVVGTPVDIDGFTVHRGAPAPQMDPDVLASILAEAESARETLIEPVDTLTAPPADSIEPAGNQVVTLGRIDGAVVWIFAQPNPPVPAACFLPVTLDDAANWSAACGAFGTLGLGGPSGTWTSWLNLPADTALVTAVTEEGDLRYQRPVANSAVFDGGIPSTAVFTAYDVAGNSLAQFVAAETTSSTTDAPTSPTTDAPTSPSPADPELSAAEKIIGREFNARAADANDMTEIPRELGLDGSFSEYASFPLSDAGGPAVGSVMAISPLEPGQLDPRIDIIAIVEFLSDDGAATLQSRVVDAIEVDLGAGEQLSMVHHGCRDEADPTAVVIGAVQVEADAPRTQQPTTAWQVEPFSIWQRPVDGVLCDIVTGDGPPSE